MSSITSIQSLSQSLLITASVFPKKMDSTLCKIAKIASCAFLTLSIVGFPLLLIADGIYSLFFANIKHQVSIDSPRSPAIFSPVKSLELPFVLESSSSESLGSQPNSPNSVIEPKGSVPLPLPPTSPYWTVKRIALTSLGILGIAAAGYLLMKGGTIPDKSLQSNPELHNNLLNANPSLFPDSPPQPNPELHNDLLNANPSLFPDSPPQPNPELHNDLLNANPSLFPDSPPQPNFKPHISTLNTNFSSLQGLIGGGLITALAALAWLSPCRGSRREEVSDLSNASDSDTEPDVPSIKHEIPDLSNASDSATEPDVPSIKHEIPDLSNASDSATEPDVPSIKHEILNLSNASDPDNEPDVPVDSIKLEILDPSNAPEPDNEPDVLVDRIKHEIPDLSNSLDSDTEPDVPVDRIKHEIPDQDKQRDLDALSAIPFNDPSPKGKAWEETSKSG